MLDGLSVRLAIFAARVLINFFATWCGPCMYELPHMQDLWDEFEHHDGYRMAVIARDQDPDLCIDNCWKGIHVPFCPSTKAAPPFKSSRRRAYPELTLFHLPARFSFSRSDFQTGTRSTSELSASTRRASLQASQLVGVQLGSSVWHPRPGIRRRGWAFAGERRGRMCGMAD